MKNTLLLAAVIFGVGAAAQAQSTYSSPFDPPANNNGGIGDYNAPLDPAAALRYYYFYDDVGTAGPDNYITWSAAVVPGQLYRVSVSWAADPSHNNNATFRLDYDGLLGWDSISRHDQSLMADGSTPLNAPNWSGWKDVGVFRSGGSGFAFAWDFTNNPDTGMPNTTGTVRLTPVDDAEFFPLYVSPLSPPVSSLWSTASYNPAPVDANAAPNYFFFYDGFISSWATPPLLANGTQYEVDISWAAHPAHNSLASFLLEIDETNAVDSTYWDYIFTIDQTKLADGSAPATDGQWSGWKSIGTFTATHLTAAFAWDFTAGNTGPNTTGTIRIRPVTTETLPILSIDKLGSDIVLSWPSPSTGYVLKENSDLSLGNWTTVIGTIADSGTTKSVTIPSPTGKNFYRLEK